MNTEVAQLIALVCHCNAALRGMQTPAFGLDHSTCRVCAHVTFARLGPRPIEEMLDDGETFEQEDANTPFEWLVRLVGTRPHGLRLVYEETPLATVPDRYLAALTPGTGNWLVEVVTRAGVSELWSPRWEVADGTRLDRRIWNVTYVCIGHDAPNIEPANSIVEQNLRTVLQESEAFAYEQNAGVFASVFRDALRHLDGISESPVPYTDLAPPGLLSESAERLLNAAQSAWVFGGLESWNDLLLDDDAADRYDYLSERLWRAVTAAVVEVANSTYIPKPKTRWAAA